MENPMIAYNPENYRDGETQNHPMFEATVAIAHEGILVRDGWVPPEVWNGGSSYRFATMVQNPSRSCTGLHGPLGGQCRPCGGSLGQ